MGTKTKKWECNCGESLYAYQIKNFKLKCPKCGMVWEMGLIEKEPARRRLSKGGFTKDSCEEEPPRDPKEIDEENRTNKYVDFMNNFPSSPSASDFKDCKVYADEVASLDFDPNCYYRDFSAKWKKFTDKCSEKEGKYIEAENKKREKESSKLSREYKRDARRADRKEKRESLKRSREYKRDARRADRKGKRESLKRSREFKRDSRKFKRGERARRREKRLGRHGIAILVQRIFSYVGACLIVAGIVLACLSRELCIIGSAITGGGLLFALIPTVVLKAHFSVSLKKGAVGALASGVGLVSVIVLLGVLFCYWGLRDFEIKDGVLTRYYGHNESLVYLPEEVDAIGKKAFADHDEIEAVFSEYTVEIRDYAFEGCSKLKSANFSQRLQKVGEGAFKDCKALTSIAVYGKHLGPRAFEGCSSLARVELSPSVEIGEYAFADSGIKNFTVPEGAKIGKGAFYGSDIRNVTFSAYASVGDYAFAGTYLTKVSVLQGVEVGDYAFAYCKYLGEVNLYEDAEIGRCAFAFSAVSHLNVPARSRLNDFAFFGCDALITADISEWSSIGDYSFCGCNMLDSVKVRQGVVLGDYSFCGCSALYNLYFSDSATVGEGAFFACNGLTRLAVPSSVRVSARAFAECEALRDVAFYSFSVPAYAFSDCKALESVFLCDGADIGEYAFNGCSALDDFTVPSGATIRKFAFNGCRSLSSLRLPIGTTAAEYAFGGCAAEITGPYLENMTGTHGMYKGYLGKELKIYPFTVVKAGDFADCIAKIIWKNTNMKSLAGVFENYKGTEVEIPYGIAVLQEGDLAGCDRVEKVTLPDSLKEIGSMTFGDCAELKEISVPSSVEKIGKGAFCGCSVLQSIELPFVGHTETSNELEDDVSHTFGYIFGSESFTDARRIGFGSNKTYVPKALKKVKINGGAIPVNAFKNCKDIEILDFGVKVSDFGSSCMYSCDGLKEVHIRNMNVAEFPEYMFAHCGAFELYFAGSQTRYKTINKYRGFLTSWNLNTRITVYYDCN